MKFTDIINKAAKLINLALKNASKTSRQERRQCYSNDLEKTPDIERRSLVQDRRQIQLPYTGQERRQIQLPHSGQDRRQYRSNELKKPSNVEQRSLMQDRRQIQLPYSGQDRRQYPWQDRRLIY